MQPRSLSHLSDRALAQELKSLVARDRVTTAELLAHLAEFDARKLHRPAGFSSLFEYCVQELGMSEDMACKRSVAARAARRHASILPAIADGRLHLSGVVMLAPYLKQAPSEARSLLAAAERRTRAEIALLIATRFPSEAVPTSIRPMVPAAGGPTPVAASGGVTQELPTAQGPGAPLLAPEPAQVPVSAESSAPGRMEFLEIPAILTSSELPPAPRTSIAPLSAESYELRCTISREFHEKIVRAQELLSHAVPSGDVVQVLERCVDAFLARAERTGPSDAARSRPGRPPASGAPHGDRRVPLRLRRSVRKRDGDRCTFVSESGRRCEARRHLECDHVVPVAKGGRTTLENLRLVCRSHNQYLAERELGAGFMERKRGAAVSRRESERAWAKARTPAATAAVLASPSATIARNSAATSAAVDPLAHRRAEIVPFLTGLGYSLEHARRGAAMCDGMVESTLHERVRFAIARLGPDPDRLSSHAREAAG